MTPERIQRVRKALNEDTATFGNRFGRSGRTVEAWEQGIRNPDPLVLKELQRIMKGQEMSIEAERSWDTRAGAARTGPRSSRRSKHSPP